ncbi:MAG: GNAT family N-acetyltransferase, partial [Hymenobacteraceae bacterium]|nr:GNAT family N-acetyltransferase [Hymenobacteraceae bacterium]MDX5395282.1 GNAT family N-acetyltransferase [Hymenobacteraceae bacterium]MDX5444102.1 GNAT family N-acetyltransferase [Hymenobacteraceae bacterium]MDX5511318.1 GNAT family N-acetyltransferase [Hymenobacteraceae bacterium]
MENNLLSAIEISTDKNKLDRHLIHKTLSQTYWAQNIPRQVVDKSIDHAFCFGVYLQGEQIGFARVITDYTTFAYLSDVFVLEPYMGKGVAKELVNHMLQHPELQGLRRWVLVTKDAQTLYQQLGFEPLKFPERYME